MSDDTPLYFAMLVPTLPLGRGPVGLARPYCHPHRRHGGQRAWTVRAAALSSIQYVDQFHRRRRRECALRGRAIQNADVLRGLRGESVINSDTRRPVIESEDFFFFIKSRFLRDL